MGTGNKVEMVIAVCAVVTSALAVFIAWDQGRVMRAQQHGSVYPVLQLNGYTSTDPEVREIGVVFRNSGVGPALIESVDVFRGDEQVESLIPYRDALPPGYSFSWTSMVGRAIAPGETLDALSFSWPVEQMSREEMEAAAEDWGGLTMKICYCSVFKRCWNVEGLAQNSPAERVKSCKRSEQDIIEGLSTVKRAQDLPNQELE